MRRYDAVLGLLLLGIVWASIAICCTGCDVTICECTTSDKDGGR